MRLVPCYFEYYIPNPVTGVSGDTIRTGIILATSVADARKHLLSLSPPVDIADCYEAVLNPTKDKITVRTNAAQEASVVLVVVSDLQWDGDSLCINGCWKRQYLGYAKTRKGAIRMALAQYGTGWEANAWAQNDESWKMRGAMIGAYVEEDHGY